MRVEVYCEICQEHIGNCDTEDLALPLRGAMFLSRDPVHGFPPPFVYDVDWEHMRCPYGQHRPFIEPNRIKTDQGFIIVAGRAVEQSEQLHDEVLNQETTAGKPDAQKLKTNDETPADNPASIQQTNQPVPEVHFYYCGELTEYGPAIFECQCFLCGKLFFSPVEYDEKCPRCAVGLPPVQEPKGPSIVELERAYREAHGDEQTEQTATDSPAKETQSFKCSICEKPFKSQKALNGHMRTHSKR